VTPDFLPELAKSLAHGIEVTRAAAPKVVAFYAPSRPWTA
jgi:hypothetical protein